MLRVTHRDFVPRAGLYFGTLVAPSVNYHLTYLCAGTRGYTRSVRLEHADPDGLFYQCRPPGYRSYRSLVSDPRSEHAGCCAHFCPDGQGRGTGTTFQTPSLKLCFSPQLAKRAQLARITNYAYLTLPRFPEEDKGVGVVLTLPLSLLSRQVCQRNLLWVLAYSTYLGKASFCFTTYINALECFNTANT